MNKYSITYQNYGRGDSQVCTTTFTAPNDKAAALVASPHICFGCGNFDIDELDEEDIQTLKDMSTEDIIESFNCEDGGDYIFSLKNETDDKVLFVDDMNGGYEDDDDVEFTEEMFEGIL